MSFPNTETQVQQAEHYQLPLVENVPEGGWPEEEIGLPRLNTPFDRPQLRGLRETFHTRYPMSVFAHNCYAMDGTGEAGFLLRLYSGGNL